MQDYITAATLQNFGITVKDEELQALLTHLNDVVNERVGAEVTESLDDEKLQQLLDLQETGTDEQVGDFIAANVPEFEQIIDDNIAITIGELAENSQGINGASN